MATARVPITNALHEIDINVDGESDSPGISIGPNDTVEFHNLAAFSVSIQFICANGPVFNNIASIAPGKTSAAQSPQIDEITTDYNVLNLNTGDSQGPYSIEVGINTNTVPAPLLVPIASANPPDDMATVAVPQNGWIQFDLDASYNLAWLTSNVFPAPSNPIGPGLSPTYQAQTGNQNGSSDYTLTSTAGTPPGGGTVKIES
jgi:hypothetical protein